MVSESHYESVFHSSSIGSVLVSPSFDPIFLDVNDAFLRATSRNREDLVGKRLFKEFVEAPNDSDGVNALRNSIERVITTGKPDTLPEQRYPIKIVSSDGTGHSSLAYLVRLPLNKVKIDRSFVSPLNSDSACRAVTNAMIALGQPLKLDVVAEGVETEDLFNHIRSSGCT